MNDVEQAGRPLNTAERVQVLVWTGVELDKTLRRHGYIMAEAGAEEITSDPRNSALVGVMATAQAYLSPMTDEYERYWPSFIAVAKHSVNTHGDNHQRIIFELYDFVGDVLMRMDGSKYPAYPPS